MWKHMMQAAEHFIAGSLFGIPLAPEDTTDFCLGPARCDRSAPPRTSDYPCPIRS